MQPKPLPPKKPLQPAAKLIPSTRLQRTWTGDKRRLYSDVSHVFEDGLTMQQSRRAFKVVKTVAKTSNENHPSGAPVSVEPKDLVPNATDGKRARLTAHDANSKKQPGLDCVADLNEDYLKARRFKDYSLGESETKSGQLEYDIVTRTPITPKGGKRKTTDDDISSSPSRGSPLRKKSKISMSSLPPAVKASQKKVTARFADSLTMPKIEALHVGVTHRARSTAPRKDRGYRILQLSCEQLQLFKKLVTPAFRAVIAAQPYPWDNNNPELLSELQFIWNVVYPTVPRNLQANGEEYAVSAQRICEYRARIARDVMTAVENYLDDVLGNTNAPSVIEEQIDHLLERGKARYMWQKSDSDNPKEFEGLFMAPYIIAGMTSHLEMTAGLPDELQVAAYPRGALALATVAAERALLAWSSGVNKYGEDISNKKEEEFSESNWGVSTKAVMHAIERLSEKKWKKIMSAATEASTAVQTTPRLAKVAMYALDDARALAYESDSS
ncbi:hypothetical protein M378DRAFT_11608 [Amanita muscaria Koide BX008]|uniref:Uncharacterized protein n=1 Tax=Amanita muscaria (strain Koide BX008) TaxID=946122 RepID=A0A0C2TBU5_AMAMK|nr:hypothetical protein M378DRAFT_11608 [Amanita muscaria Koide BX008]